MLERIIVRENNTADNSIRITNTMLCGADNADQKLNNTPRCIS